MILSTDEDASQLAHKLFVVPLFRIHATCHPSALTRVVDGASEILEQALTERRLAAQENLSAEFVHGFTLTVGSLPVSRSPELAAAPSLELSKSKDR